MPVQKVDDELREVFTDIDESVGSPCYDELGPAENARSSLWWSRILPVYSLLGSQYTNPNGTAGDATEVPRGPSL